MRRSESSSRSSSTDASRATGTSSARRASGIGSPSKRSVTSGPGSIVTARSISGSPAGDVPAGVGRDERRRLVVAVPAQPGAHRVQLPLDRRARRRSPPVVEVELAARTRGGRRLGVDSTRADAGAAAGGDVEAQRRAAARIGRRCAVVTRACDEAARRELRRQRLGGGVGARRAPAARRSDRRRRGAARRRRGRGRRGRSAR